MMPTESLLNDLKQLLNNSNSPQEGLQALCEKLQSTLATYNWVGFYFMKHEDRTLHLGPYAGKPTDHTVISFGSGICGQVAVSGESYLSADVSAEENYIACSIDVKSEIVVPLYWQNELVGQIDIDSNTANAFGSDDDKFLQLVNAMIAEHYGAALKTFV